jgi:hypothetical protein
MSPIGKFIIFLGILLVVTGLIIIFINKTFPLGELPGDITVEKGNFRFYFPLTTSLVISAVLSALAFLVISLF